MGNLGTLSGALTGRHTTCSVQGEGGHTVMHGINEPEVIHSDPPTREAGLADLEPRLSDVIAGASAAIRRKECEARKVQVLPKGSARSLESLLKSRSVSI